MQEFCNYRRKSLAANENVCLYSSKVAGDGAYLFLSPSDILAAKIDGDSDSEDLAIPGPARTLSIRPKTHKHGIELQPCQHAFCGVSLFVLRMR
jgi:hypothetical protein